MMIKENKSGGIKVEIKSPHMSIYIPVCVVVESKKVKLAKLSGKGENLCILSACLVPKLIVPAPQGLADEVLDSRSHCTT